MKKLFTLVLAIVVVSVASKAQTFAILNDSDEVITGSTIVIPITVNNEVGFDIKIQNLTGVVVNAKISKLFTEGPVADSFNSMCSPTTETSAGACVTSTTTPTFTLNPSEVSGLAAMHFDQGPNPGVSTVRYKVYNTANEADFVVVYYTFSTQTSINTSIATDFVVFPNPASRNFTIEHNYGPKAVIEVFNVLGKSVAKIYSGADNQISIDCSKWENGYYFCRLFNDGKIEKTIKLIVTH